jgi:hypothetical protein
MAEKIISTQLFKMHLKQKNGKILLNQKKKLQGKSKKREECMVETLEASE